MKPLILFHAGCWDGFCAAWIARKKFDEIEAIPVHYGNPIPDVTRREVFILDFSYSRDVLLGAYKQAASLVVLDHHATAREALSGLGFCKFESDKSGARMAWEYWFGLKPSPWLVDYVEDRDLWRHALPNSMEINAAIRSYPLDFEQWDQIEVMMCRDDLAVEGHAIRRAEKQVINTQVRNAHEIELGGFQVLCVNATAFFSETAGELAKDRPFGACWFERKDGHRQWSLRSDENGIDVSQIAKRHGGGGHFHAAGFEQIISHGIAF